MQKSVRLYYYIFSLLLITGMFVSVASAQVPKDYKGLQFKDSVYTQGPQVIPGRVELAYYDFGGEGAQDAAQRDRAGARGFRHILHFSVKKKAWIFRTPRTGRILTILTK